MKDDQSDGIKLLISLRDQTNDDTSIFLFYLYYRPLIKLSEIFGVLLILSD